jgi:hypothetical protein
MGWPVASRSAEYMRRILLANPLSEARVTPICFKVLALFCCTGVVGICQSVAPAPMTSARVDESRQGPQQWTDCKKSTSDFSVSNLAPRQGERRSNLQAWRWDDAQVDSKSAFHSPFLIPTAQSCPFNQELWRSFQAKLEPFPTQSPNSKSQPIPTEWPNAKFEAIPTDWPSLKVVPLASQPGTPATIPTK